MRGGSVARSNGKDDGCSGFDECDGTGLTNTTRSTGEEGRLAGKVEESDGGRGGGLFAGYVGGRHCEEAL